MTKFTNLDGSCPCGLHALPKDRADNPPGHPSHMDYLAKAFSKSLIRSSLSSMPTENRTRPSVSPLLARSSAGIDAWVMVGMTNQRFYSAQTFCQSEKLKTADQFFCFFIRQFKFGRDHPAETRVINFFTK